MKTLKAAPCLLKELLAYDPRTSFDDDATLHKGFHCQHVYNHTDKSKIPAIGERAAPGTVWLASCVCSSCYCHLELSLDFSDCRDPCPTPDNPLHYFCQHGTTVASVDGGSAIDFICKSESCNAILTIRVDPAVLTSRNVETLTSAERLKSRYHKVLQHRERNSVEEISAFRALTTLRSYVNNALHDPDVKKIPAANRFFMLALGSDNNTLLERLGFTYEPGVNGLMEGFWRPPKIVDQDSSSSGEISRRMLGYVLDELNVLVAQRPPSERVIGRFQNLMPAIKDVERILGTLDYETSNITRPPAVSHSLANSYRALGALQDFSDELISYCYDQQVVSEPDRAPTSLSALKDIAHCRRSELLQVKASTIESQGLVSADAITGAYQFFGIAPEHQAYINDDHIKGCYLSRVQDSSQEGKLRAKQALEVLAKVRNSEMLRVTAANEIRTYAEALDFLGADHNTADEWISTLAATKYEEDPSTTQRALDLISEERQNPSLKFAVNKPSEANGSNMDLSTAYILIGCDEDKTEEEVATQASIRFSDSDTERKKEVREALSVIAANRKSDSLKNYVEENLNIPTTSAATYPSEEPRGLENIGQTCYLNSLLQYFFTFRQVREMVLDFENLRQDPDPRQPFVRKVGNLQIEPSAIRRAQHFVQELQGLFKDMIETDKFSIVPRDELAGLTLKLTPSVIEKNEEPSTPGVRRRSTLSGESPRLTRRSISSTTVPAIPTPPTPPGTDIIMSDAVQNSTVSDRNASDTKVDTIPEENETEDARRVSNAALEDDSSVQTPALPPRSVARNELAIFAQQNDVSEVLESVLEQLRLAFRPEGKTDTNEQIDAISREAIVRVKGGKREPVEVQPFYMLYLVLSELEKNDMYAAIDNYSNGGADSIFDNNLFDALVIKESPPILQFYVQRLTFSQGSETKKNYERLELDEIIYMDRYLDDDDMFELRTAKRRWKQELKDLQPQLKELEETELGVDMASVLRLTQSYMEDQAAKNGTSVAPSSAALDQLANATEQAVEQMRARIKELEDKIATAFDDAPKKCAYRLHSVFVHRGGPASGHWFIYIFDTRQNLWRCYNDETVTIVKDSKEFLRPDEHGRETSAVVSYVRADQSDVLVETVKRVPKILEQPQDDTTTT